MLDESRGADGPADRLLWFFAGTSLLAVLAGCFVAAQAGVGTSSWARNLVAWLLGALAATAISRRHVLAWLPAAIAAATLIGLAATFIDEGSDGIYRWWDLGPLHVNAAALLLPAVIVALAGSGSPPFLVPAASIGLAALLAAQPDASQATGFCAAMAATLALRDNQSKLRWITVATLTIIGALSWLRDDPLEPIPEVEGIVRLAWQVAPLAGVLGVVGLAASALSPLATHNARGRGILPGALPLSIYIAVTALAPAAGAYPVPLMGIGMSPILGLWLGMGLLAATAAPADQAARRSTAQTAS